MNWALTKPLSAQESNNDLYLRDEKHEAQEFKQEPETKTKSDGRGLQKVCENKQLKYEFV